MNGQNLRNFPNTNVLTSLPPTKNPTLHLDFALTPAELQNSDKTWVSKEKKNMHRNPGFHNWETHPYHFLEIARYQGATFHNLFTAPRDEHVWGITIQLIMEVFMLAIAIRAYLFAT